MDTENVMTKEYYVDLEKDQVEDDDAQELKMVSDFLLGNEDLKKQKRNAKLRYKRAKLIIPLLGENDKFDLIAAPHNVLRKEMERLYNMVEFFRKYPEASTTLHTHNFFVWWDHVASFLSCYFQAEQDVIFKAATMNNYLPKELDSTRRRVVVEAMHELMSTFNDSMKLIGARPPAEPIQKVGKKLELLSILLSYFRDIERLLGPIFQDFDDKEINKLFREYGKKLLANGRWRHYHLLLITNGLEPDYAKTWVHRSIPRLTYWNSKTFTKQFDISHTRVVNHMINLMREREGDDAVNIAKTTKTRGSEVHTTSKFDESLSAANLNDIRGSKNDLVTINSI